MEDNGFPVGLGIVAAGALIAGYIGGAIIVAAALLACVLG